MKKLHHEEIILTSLCILILALMAALIVTMIQSSSTEAHRSKANQVKTTAAIEEAETTEAPTTTAPYQYYYDIPLDTKYQTLVFELCEEYNIPATIVFGVMWQESKYDFMAISSDGTCIGIMQIHSINYDLLKQHLSINNLKDPEENIRSGVWLLQRFYKKYGSWDKSLTCYNLGENGAKGISSSKYSKSVINYSEGLVNG